jgi:hypothetical protein
MAASSALIREYVQLTQESSFGVPVGSPTRGTSQIAIRLPGSNQQTMRPNPLIQAIPYGGGFSVIKDTVSDKTELKGTLTTPLCYSQASFLLGWAMERIGTGGTTPWTTSEVAQQFASCTLDHAIMYDDNGVFRRTRYTGCKVDGVKVTVSNDAQYATLALDIIASKYSGNTFDSSTDPTLTDDPLPLDSEFPTDFVLFVESGGGYTLGTGVRAEYTSLSLAGQHQHDVRYYGNRFVQVMRSFGTMYTLDSDFTLISSPDDRASFNTIGALACQVVFTNGTHTLTFDFKGHNRIKGLDDDTPIGKIYGRKLSLENRYDSMANAWFGFTFV